MIPQIQSRRAEFEKIVTNEQGSFYWSHGIGKQFTAPYHYHPEFELIFIPRGRGRRLVGTSIEHFGPGDLVLIPPNFPHIWQVSSHCLEAEFYCIQFLPEFVGTEFFKLPEMHSVWKWMSDIHTGMTFDNVTCRKVGAWLEQFLQLSQTERLLGFLDILRRLSVCAKARNIGEPIVAACLNLREEKRINEVFNYLNQNLSTSISQKKVAQSVRLSSPAFSRLFKKTTGKCFTQVVCELRISQVCRLLTETGRSISEIAFETGFESLSCFHFQFRRIMKMTPGEYRTKFEVISSQAQKASGASHHQS